MMMVAAATTTDDDDDDLWFVIQNLKEVLASTIPEQRKQIKEFVSKHGNEKIADVTLEQVGFHVVVDTI